MRRLTAALALVVTVFAPFGALAAAPTVIKLEPYRKTVAMHATINGVEGFFTFDTGGGVTIVSPALADKLGCKPFRRIVGFRMMGDRLDLPACAGLKVAAAGREIGAVEAGVFDVAPLIAKDAAPIDGSIALDAFDGQVVTLDMSARTLTVETRESLARRVRTATEIPARIGREAAGSALDVYAGVPTAKGRVWFELDSGNGGTLLVSKPLAALFGLDPAKEGPQEGRITVAPGIVAEGRAFTPDMILDGNLGVPFLSRHAVTMDLKAGRLWIAPTAAK